MTKLFVSAFAMTLIAPLVLPGSPLSKTGYPASPNFRDGRFQNSEPAIQPGFWRSIAISWKFLTKKSRDSRPRKPLDVQNLNQEILFSSPDNSLWRLGHSTVLMKLDGKFWLTDPVFAERAGPVGFAGPRRFHRSPILVNDLPAIETVIISHDHYDHLDRKTIAALIPHVQRFVTPLGVGERLIAWGVPAQKVHQLDWWQELEIGRLRLIATPAKHFSGRSIGDRNRTLWASWVLISPQLKLFFSGDTGYSGEFKRIGERFGPFDLTMIEAGAYYKEWSGTHITPEESVQAHIDLRGRWMLPIHNGTFDLAFHSWIDPFERISTASGKNSVAVLTPRFGERIDIAGPIRTTAWWRVPLK